jgi:hypothetical protein
MSSNSLSQLGNHRPARLSYGRDLSATDMGTGICVTAVDCGSPTVLARIWYGTASWQEC